MAKPILKIWQITVTWIRRSKRYKKDLVICAYTQEEAVTIAKNRIESVPGMRLTDQITIHDCGAPQPRRTYFSSDLIPLNVIGSEIGDNFDTTAISMSVFWGIAMTKYENADKEIFAKLTDEQLRKTLIIQWAREFHTDTLAEKSIRTFFNRKFNEFIKTDSWDTARKIIVEVDIPEENVTIIDAENEHPAQPESDRPQTRSDEQKQDEPEIPNETAARHKPYTEPVIEITETAEDKPADDPAPAEPEKPEQKTEPKKAPDFGEEQLAANIAIIETAINAVDYEDEPVDDDNDNDNDSDGDDDEDDDDGREDDDPTGDDSSDNDEDDDQENDIPDDYANIDVDRSDVESESEEDEDDDNVPNADEPSSDIDSQEIKENDGEQHEDNGNEQPADKTADPNEPLKRNELARSEHDNKPQSAEEWMAEAVSGLKPDILRSAIETMTVNYRTKDGGSVSIEAKRAFLRQLAQISELSADKQSKGFVALIARCNPVRGKSALQHVYDKYAVTLQFLQEDEAFT